VIKKTEKGYQVTSEDGRALSRPNLTKEQARKRLALVEYFKSRAKKGK
jgi:hypothetical protein